MKKLREMDEEVLKYKNKPEIFQSQVIKSSDADHIESGSCANVSPSGGLMGSPPINIKIVDYPLKKMKSDCSS